MLGSWVVKRLWLTSVVLPLMGITAGIGSPMAYAAETPLVINTTSVAFGNVNVGSTSAPMTTVITNTSGQSFGPLHVAGGAPASGKFGGVQSCNGATLQLSGDLVAATGRIGAAAAWARFPVALLARRA